MPQIQHLSIFGKHKYELKDEGGIAKIVLLGQ